MNNRLLEADLNEIKDGYRFQPEIQCYTCLTCGKTFEVGEVFQINTRWFDALRAIKEHVQTEHGGVLDHLLELDKKYTNLTEKQISLVKNLASGMTDKEIAKSNNIAAATVRHQRFMFREKAKQAKIYLAIYESMERATSMVSNDSLMDTHLGAVAVDERYILTVEEDQKIIETYFNFDHGLRLNMFPSKEKRKIAVLRKIVTQFEPSKEYSEQEMNEILRQIYDDVSTIRRYLIEYGFFERTKDGSRYWIK